MGMRNKNASPLNEEDSKKQDEIFTTIDKNEILTIDTNASDCIFKLLQIAALMEAKNGKIQVVKRVSKRSKKLFEQAREGQGFSTIEIIYKDFQNDCWIKETFFFPIFNDGDGLPREDKEGRLYDNDESVTIHKKVGQSGSGIMHTKARRLALRELLKRKNKEKNSINLNTSIHKISKQDDVPGCVLGGAIVKGAESSAEKDYKVHILNQSIDSLDISNIRASFSKTSLDDSKKEVKPEVQPELHISLLEKYKMQGFKEKHLFLIPNDESKSYEIYYILNGKFARSAIKEGISEIHQDKINSFIQDIDQEKNRQNIVLECLKALSLNNYFTINNKSTSQNKSSIFYKRDFESFIMFLNPEKYLFDDNKQIMPEGAEWGSYFDLQRSEAMVLAGDLCDELLKCFNIQDKEKMDEIKKQQRSQCSSWDDKYPYYQVIKDYLNASNEYKLQVYTNNIHIALRLYEKALIMYNEKKPIWGRLWTEFDLDIYLIKLEMRLTQLLISYYQLSKTLYIHSEFKSDLFGEDKRSLSQIWENFRKFNFDGGRNYFRNLYKIIFNSTLDQLLVPSQSVMKNMAEMLCDSEEKNDCSDLINFNHLLENANLVCSDEQEIKSSLEKLLTETQVESVSALENLVEKESYQAAMMVLYYGGINEDILEKVSNVLINRISTIKSFITDAKSSSPKEDSFLILDDFLRSFIRQTQERHLTLSPKLMNLISDHSNFLPKAANTLEQLGIKQKKQSPLKSLFSINSNSEQKIISIVKSVEIGELKIVLKKVQEGQYELNAIENESKQILAKGLPLAASVVSNLEKLPDDISIIEALYNIQAPLFSRRILSGVILNQLMETDPMFIDTYQRNHGKTILMQAVAKSNHAMVYILLKNKKIREVLLNEKNQFGANELNEAITQGNQQIVNLLIQNNRLLGHDIRDILLKAIYYTKMIMTDLKHEVTSKGIETTDEITKYYYIFKFLTECYEKENKDVFFKPSKNQELAAPIIKIINNKSGGGKF